MFVNTRLYQYNNVSSQCVYIFDNFLESDYQQLILNKTLELTEIDYLNKSTNVQANVTEVNELFHHEEYTKLKDKIASYLNTIITLRFPHWGQQRKLYPKNMWGMQHFKGDFTRKHCHGNDNWSGAYYARCPDQTKIYFEDVESSEVIRENSLYIFPGPFQHYTDVHTSDISRVGVAFNFNVEWLQPEGHAFNRSKDNG